jgi:hypothetical protein
MLMLHKKINLPSISQIFQAIKEFEAVDVSDTTVLN